MKQNKKNEYGFTLIELLMVIAIIMILVSITWVAVGQMRGRGRDARRARDINQLHKALEMYHSGEQEYPLNDEGLISSCDNNWQRLLTILKESPEVVDPINSTSYCYYYTADKDNSAQCNGRDVGSEIGFIIGFKAESRAPDTFGQLTGITECDNGNCYCLADKL
ncbi:MAG TPA: type II secretion system protein [Candidatus Vogelbacteria bacterium]|nr:type II secretion system protein [Candidatus Vogelbacteria bacterium]